MLNLKLDNHDSRIRRHSLIMERMDLEQIDRYDLPEGYHFTFYQPGDRDHWIAIEQSAKELNSYEQGLDAWERYYTPVLEGLEERMLFIETEQGEKVATITAYYDPKGELPPERGQIHWVAVRRDHQGKGLARPLLSRALQLLKQHGHTEAVLHTGTPMWVAVRLYLQFGFRPTTQSAAENHEGWRIIRALTDHPALASFEPAREDEILTE